MKAEDNVRQYYKTGWAVDAQGVTKEKRRWEDLRECASTYTAACRRRVQAVLPASGERMLDAASGPIQFQEYIDYSHNFKKRYCVDLSVEALEGARLVLGSHGEYVNESILDLAFPDNYFDASLSLHTIFHIDRNEQARAVRNLLRMTAPGAPLIVIYSNPMAPVHCLARLASLAKKVFRRRSTDDLYFYAHPLSWWRQFGDEASVVVQPWRSLGGVEMRALIPNNQLGSKFLGLVFRAETLFPSLALTLGRYAMITLRKR